MVRTSSYETRRRRDAYRSLSSLRRPGSWRMSTFAGTPKLSASGELVATRTEASLSSAATAEATERFRRTWPSPSPSWE
jgi:hypothetical protein